MPSITCTCGNIIATGSFPNLGAYLAISENDYDDLEKIDVAAELDKLLFSSTRIYKCSKCGELVVFWKGKAGPEFFKKN